jgi:hypothetical protein
LTTLRSTVISLRQNVLQHNGTLALAGVVLLGLAAGTLVLAARALRQPRGRLAMPELSPGTS